jgi:hypothetical protein
MDLEMCGSILKDQGVVDDNPILKFPDMDENFLVCTGASKEILDEVLRQDDPVIAYISRKLRKHEDNYAMHNLEFLSIVYS